MLARALPEGVAHRVEGTVRVAPVFDPEMAHDVVLATSPATDRRQLMAWARLFRMIGVRYAVLAVARWCAQCTACRHWHCSSP